MEANEKLMRMLDMLDNPGKYTEQEFKETLNDEECREYYDMLTSVKDVCEHKKNTVTDETVHNEWKRFEKAHFRSIRTSRHVTAVRRIVVAASVALIISISYAAIQLISDNGTPKRAEGAKDEAVDTGIKDALAVVVKEHKADTLAVRCVRTYDNTELEIILDDIAKGYGMKVGYNNDAVKHLRLFFQWNTEESVENVIKSLNAFERVNINIEGKKLTVE